MAANQPAPRPADDFERTAKLAKAAREGDLSRFEQLYERVAPSLYAWASLRAPRGVDPGDILGEVWLRAVRGLKSHDVENHEFRAWIFGIAKHVLLQVLRARGSVIRGAVSLADSRSSTELSASVTNVSRRLSSDDAVQTFLRHAESLDPEDRELLVYCALEGFAAVDAAARLGISPETATKRWQRLRAQLRESAWVQKLLLNDG